MFFLDIVSAVLTCQIFPKLNVYILAFISLVPMLFLVNYTESKKRIFFYGFLFGFILQGYFHIWIFYLKVWGPLWGIFLIWFSYTIYLALFYAFAFLLFASFKKFTLYELSFPGIWVVFEWLRSFGPFGNTAAAFGYSQTANLSILQIASILGVYGLSFYIVLINVLIYMIILFNFKSIRVHLLLSLVLIILIPYTWGFHYANSSKIKSVNPFLNVSIIQGNHGQNFKYDKENRARIQNDYFTLSKNSTTNKPDLVFWPETIIPALNLYDISFMINLNGFIKENNCAVLFGSPVESHNKYYNSAVLITPAENLPQTYFKNVLMPFGEYIPFRFIPKKLGFLLEGEDYSVGQTQNLLNYKGVKFGGGICLESIYPAFYRRFVKNGADVLFVLVNNAWFFKSAAAAEHLQMSIMRAVENNRYLVQSSSTGLSAIINNRGKVIVQSKLDEQIILSSPVYFGLPHSVYFYLGDSIVYLSILVILVLLLFLFRKKKSL